MFSNGVYKVYTIVPTNGAPHERFSARFLIDKGNFHVLEDHGDMFSSSINEGPMDHDHEKLLWLLAHSGYHKVIPENEINEGLHDKMLSDLDIGSVEPDQEFLLTGATLDEPMRLQMFGPNYVLDGHKLAEDEVKQIMERVHSAELKMIPIPDNHEEVLDPQDL